MWIQKVASVLAGFACVIGGMLAGGVFGCFAGLNEAAHTPNSGWFDLRGLDAPVGALIGGGVGAAIGSGVAFAAALAKSARYFIVAIFLFLAGGVGAASVWRYHAGQERDAAAEMDSWRQGIASRARQQANYSRLNGPMSALPYPGSRLWPQRPGDPISMTSGDTPQTVANYYARLLAVPLSGAPCGAGPSQVCWNATADYLGAPLQISISDDDLNDGGKTSIIISTSDESPMPHAPLAAATSPVTPAASPVTPDGAPMGAPPAAPPNTAAISPISGADASHPDPLAAQRAKIVKVRADLGMLGYPGAQENEGGDPSLMLNFTTSDSADAVGAYYRNQLGFALRPVQSNGAPAWTGEAAYHDTAMHIAVFNEGGVTRIQIS